jgi:D-3-phosphoglycerate dehydrogenase / 2-oxoglutarate reductase
MTPAYSRHEHAASVRGAASDAPPSLRILLLSPIDPQAVDVLGTTHHITSALNPDPDSLASILHDKDVVVFRSGVALGAEVIRDARQLRLLIRAGSGLDNIDVEEVRRRGIRLVRVPGPGAQAVAEMTFALLLDIARRVSLADRSVRRARWPKPQLIGSLTHGKTLGVVGVGNIGTRVGELGARWGMRVVGCVEHPSPQRAERFARRGITLTALEDVAAQADFLSIHVPLKDSTRYLVDGRVLARMKPGAYVINIARGGILDEEALSMSLDAGRLAGAALDVHEKEGDGVLPELARHQNVVLTPHIGAMAAETQQQIGRRVLRLIDGFILGTLDHEAEEDELIV